MSREREGREGVRDGEREGEREGGIEREEGRMMEGNVMIIICSVRWLIQIDVSKNKASMYDIMYTVVRTLNCVQYTTPVHHTHTSHPYTIPTPVHHTHTPHPYTTPIHHTRTPHPYTTHHTHTPHPYTSIYVCVYNDYMYLDMS